MTSSHTSAGANSPRRLHRRTCSRWCISKCDDGTRVNGGLRDSYQRHHWLTGEFGRTLTNATGLYNYGGRNAGREVPVPS